MMRRLLLCGIAAATLTASEVAAQPLQITPPAARPPTSVPAKKPASTKPAQKPVAAKPAQKPVAAKPAHKPVVARSAAPGSVEPKTAKPPPVAPLPPSAFAPEQTPAVPFTPPEKSLPQATQQAALQSPPASGAQGDVAFGAFQRGYYLEAFKEASRRAGEGDPVAMTLLGELYANGYGVPKDETKALAWFSLAADRGDRQAIFALAMLRFAGRGGPQDQAEAAALLEKAAKLCHVAAMYNPALLEEPAMPDHVAAMSNLALLYIDGRQVRRDAAHAAELMRTAADAGSPE